MTCTLLDGITLPWPRVTSSTWAMLAHNRNMKKAAADATMIILVPVIGRRCLIAGPTKGRVAMAYAYSGLAAGDLCAARCGRRDRRRGLAFLRGDQPRSRGPAFVRSRDVQCPSLRRVEQSPDVVRRTIQDRSVGDRS